MRDYLDDVLDSLAECFGCNLQWDHCDGLDGVWYQDPVSSEWDIIGSGETRSEAIDAARTQLRAWEHAEGAR